MKCRSTQANPSIWRFFHRLWCAECRRHKIIDDAVERAAKKMRAVVIPAASKEFLDSLPITNPTRTRRTTWPYAVGACMAIAAIVLTGIFAAYRPAKEHKAVPVVRHDVPENKSFEIPRVKPTESHMPQALAARTYRQNPFPRSSSKAPAKDVVEDEIFLNPGRYGTAIAFDSEGPQAVFAALPKMRDDFATPAAMLIAANATPEEIRNLTKQVLEAYDREAQVVDHRLFKNVTLSLKHASFDEVCKELKRQTGVEMDAGRNVADDNATIFVDSRPAREVMREISRVFGFVWERSGAENAYSYLLKQDTAAQIAEEKMRNDDVSKSLAAIAREAKVAKEKEGGLVKAAKETFANLSNQELALLKSGRQVRLRTPNGQGPMDGVLDPALAAKILKNAGGLYLVGDIYMNHGDVNAPGVIPLTELQDTSAGVMLLMRIGEFGGAMVAGEVSFNAKAPDGTTNHGLAAPVSLGAVAGPSEKPIENAKDNAKLRETPAFTMLVSIEPTPTTPLAEQGFFSDEPRYGTITEMQGSYRTHKSLQPPRPFMTTDDFWQAVHEKTKKDIVADSFSRLVPLRKFEGKLFDVLSAGCDAMQYHWREDEGFLTGRSGVYQWQRLNEVPKRFLLKWQAEQKRNGYLPLRGVLAMSMMTDRQLDSFEVGKTIAHQWKLPEWGVPSRPHMSGPRDFVRPICRFLANLPEDQLVLAERGTLRAGEVRPDLLQTLQYHPAQDVRLRVDYIPPGYYYWAPFFDSGKDKIRDDLIFGLTRDAVLNEVRKRYPDYTRDEVSLSDGLMGLLMQGLDTSKGAVSPSYDMGDQRFGVGRRTRDG